MPPIRRTTRPGSSLRRPKIAGSAPRPMSETADAAAMEVPPASTTVVIPPPAETPSPAEAPSLVKDAATVEPVPPARFRLSWKLVGLLAAATVVLGGFAGVAALRPGTQVSNTAYVDVAGTSQVTEAVRSALETLYAYAPDSIDQYPDRARSVLTESMRAEFDKTVDPTVSAVKQMGTSTTVQLSDVGVKVLDGDRAELIVNMTVGAESNGVAQDSASGPLIVQMEKVDGVWLLSDIADQ